MLLLFSMSLYPKLRLWCQLSAFSVLHIPFKLSELFQVQWHRPDAEGTLTVLILWLCSWQSLAALIHSLAVSAGKEQRQLSVLAKGIAQLVQLGCLVGKLGCLLQLCTWVPGELQGTHPASSFVQHLWVVTVLLFRIVLKAAHFLFWQNKSQFLLTRKPQEHFLVK